MTDLSVNLNVAALLRNRREHPWPDLIGLARIALNAGAAGVTVHPRPDERHTRPDDVRGLRSMLDAEFPDWELNVEGYPDERFLSLVQQVRADQVTLVPDDPGQATSDHGWISRHRARCLRMWLPGYRRRVTACRCSAIPRQRTCPMPR